MRRIFDYFRNFPNRPLVRPWALAVPILVLVFACPLLRPLRHPDPADISREEVTRLATIQAIVEHHTLDLEAAGVRGGPYGIALTDDLTLRQPVMLAAILSPFYWLMTGAGLTMTSNPAAVAYLLTLIGSTIPVALAGGMIYRMGRFFELPRRWRTLLAFGVIFASGLISYSTVLNPHAPAAVLVLGGCAALIHAATAPRSYWVWAYVFAAGLCLMLAATISPPAIIFIVLMAFVVLAFRWQVKYRMLGLGCYALGTVLPLLLHIWISPYPLDIFSSANFASLPDGGAADLALTLDQSLGDRGTDGSVLSIIGEDLANLGIAIFGSHGLLSHFPVLILGIFGIAAVMHRHWSVAAKVFATATAGAAAVIVIGCVVWISDWSEAMFAVRWFIVFTPLLLFWAGAWMRRSHRPATWGLVGALALFSVVVSMIGATHPLPRNGYRGYTAASALRSISGGGTIDPTTAIAGAR